MLNLVAPSVIWSGIFANNAKFYRHIEHPEDQSQFIGAFRIVLPSTWWTAVCVHLTFPAVSACGQPIGISWSCHDIVAASSDADHSPLQLRWSGTHFQTPFGTQH